MNNINESIFGSIDITQIIRTIERYQHIRTLNDTDVYILDLLFSHNIISKDRNILGVTPYIEIFSKMKVIPVYFNTLIQTPSSFCCIYFDEYFVGYTSKRFKSLDHKKKFIIMITQKYGDSFNHLIDKIDCFGYN